MIGVCIKYFHENYGGMLQAFATIKMLESREMEYELIRYKKNLTLRKKIKSIPRLLNICALLETLPVDSRALRATCTVL